MNFEQFLASPLRNAWIKEPGLHIYIRRSIRKGADIDLAALKATRPGKGKLTAFLDKYESKYVFFVECIFNARLVGYLERRNYVIIDNSQEVHACNYRNGMS